LRPKLDKKIKYINILSGDRNSFSSNVGGKMSFNLSFKLASIAIVIGVITILQTF
jgi:hypothetical protein